MMECQSSGETPILKVIGLNLLAIRKLFHEFRNISLHDFPLIDLFKVMVHLCGTLINRILRTMSSCQILDLKPSTLLGTHNIFWHLNTTSPPRENNLVNLLNTYSFNSTTTQSGWWLVLTSTTNEDSELEWTETPPLGASTSRTPNSSQLMYLFNHILLIFINMRYVSHAQLT